MKVSVCITTYNHAKYITQAVESVLMQQTDFDFEIIIGEDDSADNTREIVKKYKERYPEKIRLFLNNRENVIYIDGRPTGRWNFMNNITNAKGDYIAILDGDDYWTDPLKLQRQVEFLDANPDCAMCFHDVKIIYEDKRDHAITAPPVRKERYTLEDILRGNFIYACSVMFRRGLFGEFPDWFYKAAMADWPLHILNAQHGDIGHLEEIMGVYRVHEDGIWSGAMTSFRVRNTIATYKLIDAHFGGRYRNMIRKVIFSIIFHQIETKIGLALRKSGFKAVADIYNRIFYPRSTKR